MTRGRGSGGRTGIAGSASVEMEKIDTGESVPLPADNEGLLISKMVGEDSDGNNVRIATDSAGRLKVKDVQFDGTVDIGDLQLLDTSEQKIDPATDSSLQDIRDRLGNETGISTGRNTGGGELADLTIPEGKTIRVQALAGNSGIVEINGDFELQPGQGVDLGVDNAQQISYTADSGDGVCFIVEG